MTMRDVAKEAGVSVAAVSYALRPGERPEFVSQDVQERVIEVARRLNYQVNQSASKLRRGRHYSIAIVGTSLTNWTFVEMADGILAEMAPSPYAGKIITLERVPDVEAFAKAHLGQHADDAAIFIGPSAQYPFTLLKRLQQNGLRLAVAHPERPPLQVPAIFANRVGAARLQIRTLTDYGHRSIIFVLPDTGSSSDRLIAEAAQQEATLQRASLHVLRCPAMAAGTEAFKFGVQLARHQLSQRAETGIAVFGDSLSSGILQGLRSERVNVPGSKSIIAYGCDILSDYQEPPLSFVSHPLLEMGASIARRTIAWIESGYADHLATSEQAQPRFIAKQTVAVAAAPFLVP